MLVLAAWVIAFVGFYKGWGRSPTPFYVLESIPALAIAAAGTSVWGAEGLKVFVPHLRQLLLVVSAAVIVASLYAPYPLMGALQYRGTVEVIAAKTMVTYIEQHVPAGDALFTAQPLFAHMSERPLYGYYTHPGWYLSERAGYLPREIRSVFLPDFDVLTQQVQEEVNWIVVDWRTSDVYFSEKTDDTLPLRTMLKEEFTPLLTVTNESSRDITLYRRTSYTP